MNTYISLRIFLIVSLLTSGINSSRYREYLRNHRYREKNKFSTSNGIAHSEVSFYKNNSTKSEDRVVQGIYSYTSPDNKRRVVQYTADKDGYRPSILSEEQQQKFSSQNQNSEFPDFIGTALLQTLSGG